MQYRAGRTNASEYNDEKLGTRRKQYFFQNFVSSNTTLAFWYRFQGNRKRPFSANSPGFDVEIPKITARRRAAMGIEWVNAQSVLSRNFGIFCRTSRRSWRYSFNGKSVPLAQRRTVSTQDLCSFFFVFWPEGTRNRILLLNRSPKRTPLVMTLGRSPDRAVYRKNYKLRSFMAIVRVRRSTESSGVSVRVRRSATFANGILAKFVVFSVFFENPFYLRDQFRWRQKQVRKGKRLWNRTLLLRRRKAWIPLSWIIGLV